MVSRTLLAVLLLAAPGVDRFMRNGAAASKETAAALLVVALATYLTSAAFFCSACCTNGASPESLVASVGLAARCGCSWLASVFFRLRLRMTRRKRASHRSSTIRFSSSRRLNVICTRGSSVFAAAFRWPVFPGGAEQDLELRRGCCPERLLEASAPLRTSSFRWRWSDPLTGLANYRRLISVDRAELDRSRRHNTYGYETAPLSYRASPKHGWAARSSPISTSHADREPRAGAHRKNPAQSFPARSITGPRDTAETICRWLLAGGGPGHPPRGSFRGFANAFPPSLKTPRALREAGVGGLSGRWRHARKTTWCRGPPRSTP